MMLSSYRALIVKASHPEVEFTRHTSGPDCGGGVVLALWRDVMVAELRIDDVVRWRVHPRVTEARVMVPYS